LLDITDNPIPLNNEDKPEVIQKTLKEVIQDSDELSNESKADLLKHTDLLKLRDRAGLIETASEFYIKPVES
jgi:hypothetical protein